MHSDALLSIDSCWNNCGFHLFNICYYCVPVYILLLLEQEASLMLRDRAAVAEILKGNPKYIGVSLAQSHAHFSSGCGFMVGLGKPKLYTKFEVITFNRCTNIEGKPQILGSFPSPGLRPPFLLHVILWWTLANPSCAHNLISLALAIAEIL